MMSFKVSKRFPWGYRITVIQGNTIITKNLTHEAANQEVDDFIKLGYIYEGVEE